MRWRTQLGLSGLVILSAAWVFPALGASAPGFQEYVPALSSENVSVREAAIQNLKEIPDLHAQLRASLKSSDAREATQVIRALRDFKMTEDVVDLAKRDLSTDAWVTLISLLSPETNDAIARVAEDLLVSRTDDMSSGAIIADLNILSTTGRKISPSFGQKLLANESYEVRIALLGYVGNLISKHRGEDYLGLVSRALLAKPYQLRLGALDVVKSLSPAQRDKSNPHGTIMNALKSCSSDSNLRVRKECRALLAASPRSSTEGSE